MVKKITRNTLPSKLRTPKEVPFSSGKNATLIITEKPAAAEKIAAALSGATDEKVTNKDKV